MSSAETATLQPWPRSLDWQLGLAEGSCADAVGADLHAASAP